MKTFLVVNPRSANGETGKRWAEISGQVTRSIGDFGFGFTERAMDAVRLTRDALADGYECVAAVGGGGWVGAGLGVGARAVELGQDGALRRGARRVRQPRGPDGVALLRQHRLLRRERDHRP